MDSITFAMDVPIRLEDDEKAGEAFVKAKLSLLFDWPEWPGTLGVASSIEGDDGEVLELQVTLYKL